MSNTLIIDLDVMVHQCSWQPWQRLVKTVKEETLLTSIDIEGNPTLNPFTEEQLSTAVQTAYDKLMGEVNALMERLFAKDIICYVKGKGNYRDDIYADYKASRKKRPQLRNRVVPELNRILVEEGFAIASDGMEADDRVRIKARELTELGEAWVVCTIDKDLKMIGGQYYNIKHKKLYVIDKKEANRCLYKQLLEGDSTDNIPGLPGVGPVRARNTIFPCDNEVEMQEAVVDMYLMQYGEERWYDELMLTGDLIYILEYADKRFKDIFDEWQVVKELKEI